MKKKVVLGLLLVAFTSCSGEKNLKIRDVGKMDLDGIVKVMKSLTPEQAQKLGEAVGQCQANSEAQVCDATIKKVIR
ncbi:MAG: hypothetical protein GKC53_06160 [Neisseriaceae bacterium]|nr:MAG: hypothetical protein GKC53_06160 [Neisseriaceae bacterium]